VNEGETSARDGGWTSNYRLLIGGAQVVLGLFVVFVWQSTLENRDTLARIDGQLEALGQIASSIAQLEGRLRVVEREAAGMADLRATAADIAHRMVEQVRATETRSFETERRVTVVEERQKGVLAALERMDRSDESIFAQLRELHARQRSEGPPPPRGAMPP
jgi:hypothetical protein